MPAASKTTSRIYLDHLREMIDRIATDSVDRFADLLFDTWQQKRCAYTFGNGGSAATASHHACDYAKTAAVEGARRLRAICLADNTASSTAIGNDLHYDDIFVYPLETYATAGDVAVAISCSGKSRNVLKACQWAKHHDVRVVALTGRDGGILAGLADVHVNVPSEDYGVIEDMHMSIGHIVSKDLQRRVAAANTHRP